MHNDTVFNYHVPVWHQLSVVCPAPGRNHSEALHSRVQALPVICPLTRSS